MEPSRSSAKIRSLQGLRVLAFLGIFLRHAIDFPAGAWGVSIFIMLSGFVLTYSYWDRESFEIRDLKDSFLFSVRKIRSLYPLHLIMLAVALIPYYLLPAIQAHSGRELLKVAAKVCITVPLIQTWFPVGFEAINTVAWYLSAMLFLYMAFPWILKHLKKDKGIPGAICLMVIAYLLQFAFAFVSRKLPLLKNAHWSCYILPLFRLGDFTIGCCLGYCFLKRKSLRLSVPAATGLEALLLALAFAAMYAFSLLENAEWFRLTLLFVPGSAALVYCLACSRGKISQLLSSETLQKTASVTPFAFLIHRQVLHYTEDGYRLLSGKSIHPALLILVAMVLTILFSILYMKLSKKKKGAS